MSPLEPMGEGPRPSEPTDQPWAAPPPYSGPTPYDHGSYQPWGPPPPSRRQRSGIWGGIVSALLAVWAFIKYGGLFLLKFGFVKTLLTLLISLGIYSLALGPLAALAFVVMILIHEMGHVVEIRRQGMQATAPLFIPFFGAAIFQRSHPQDALHQAQIGIAGPVAGTLASIAALFLYAATGWRFFAVAALWGFFLNLFNLIPFGMLDGGWVLSAASKWFQPAGLVLLAVAVIFFHLFFSPVLILLLIMGIPTMIERFRNDRSPYYQSVPLGGKVVMGLSWLGLVAILGVGLMQTFSLLGPVG
ncbi:MAG TPA: site-2 protease family protein [Candidatus Dormibacteraeota bacterium]